MGERLTYLPSVGLCLVAGWVVSRLDDSGGLLAGLAGGEAEVKRLRVGVAIALLAGLTGALGARTFIRNQDWRDQYTLVRATAEVSPRSAKVLIALGREEERRGNKERAQALFEEAHAIVWDGLLHNPDLTRSAQAFGEHQLELGQPVEAAALFETVLRRSPNDPGALVGMARARLMQGKRDEARRYAERAASLGTSVPKGLAEELGLPRQ